MLAVSHPGPKQPANMSLALPSIEELNQRFPQLDVLQLVGRGGMGAIYRARQTSLDREVALKLIAREVAQEPAFVERFEREAKALAKLSHPNIVTVYDFGYTEDAMAYLIMEFIDGMTLRDAINARNISAGESIEVAIGICRALEYAHSRGVIHRDIKPENILLSEDGALKVVDFGIAKIVDDHFRPPTLTATRQVLGSLHYLAPEQIESPDKADHRIDLYALGVVFYEMLTGQLPLGRYDVPSAVNQQVDVRIDQIVLKLLSRKPDQRYSSAKQVETELLAVQNAGHFPKTLPPPLPKLEPHAPAISVPFSYDIMAGFAEVVGVAYARDNALVLEYRQRDKLMGTLKSQTHSAVIPINQISKMHLRSGLIKSRLIISALRLTSLQPLPNSETGSVELEVRRHNVAQAKRLMDYLGFTPPGFGLLDSEKPLIDSAQYTRQTIFGGLMILCGLFNAGGLAIGQIINASEASEFEGPIIAVSLAILFGPIAAMQLIFGILNFVLPMEKLNKAIAAISLLPVTPAWPLSVLAAVWMLRQGDVDDLGAAKRPAWGATTMIFIREWRWSRVIAATNAIAAVIAAIALAVYYCGLYPSTLTYRIVGDVGVVNAEGTPLGSLIQQRLADIAPNATVQLSENQNRLIITDWQRSRSAIETQLQIEQNVRLVWLSTSSDRTPVVNWISLAKGIENHSVLTQGIGLTRSVGGFGVPIELTADMVSRVHKQTDKELAIELTSVGRESIRSQQQSEGNAAIGIMLGDTIEAIASAEQISTKQIVFQLGENPELQLNSLVAAIRGPQLPCELELIQ